MSSGSVTLNGLSDKELVTVLEAKIKHEGQLHFSPTQVRQSQGNPPRAGVLVNDNVVVSWQNHEGFKAAIELQAELAGHRVVAKEAA